VEPNRRPAIGRFIRRNAKRVVVAILGFALLIAGGIMMVTPGPGVAAIIGGLALLATEFEWAERRLTWAKDRFDVAARRAGVSPRAAAIGGLLFLGLLLVGGTLLWLYVLR
jgi:uncharacterized protein (TIGR02611 family)